ncbi:carboxypeptidase regulatory-like domain-containing protein [Mucilaginibacter terrae]|uniref:TonB-dependent receptor n=1 Tax=Mucilaginibacter terrae TaxID=1955052 RepID=UPI003641D2BD
MNKFWFITFLILGFIPRYLLAQTTKSSLSGIVSDQNKVNMEGVTVNLLFLPAGTQYGCSTNKAGRFNLPDLKPGGPYQLQVSHTGYTTYTQNDIFLRLDDPGIINITLKSSVQTMLAEVLVSAQPGINGLYGQQTSPGLRMGANVLTKLPTIKRSINDYTRLVPQSFGSSIGGGNYRQNFITIDGSEFNNNFGVGDNLPGNGAQPISLDAIDQLSINIAPYNSIWQSGFIGSAINIVTRQGGNQLQGSAYRYFRNQDYNGYRVGDNRVEKRNSNYEQNGFRIGGPILKNKLFYFVSAEFEEERYAPQPLTAASLDMPYGATPNIARPTITELNNISNYLNTTYQYNSGSYNNIIFKNTSVKLLARFDWNIADNNTFSIRYNQLNSTRPELVNGSRSPLPSFPASMGRRNPNALPFSNSNFNTRSNFYSLATEWNFKISEYLFNTLRASYTRQYEPRESESALFPFVDILKEGTPFTSFGYEPFSYGNSRDVNIVSITDHLSWNHNKHNWLAGWQTDYSNTKNTYMPFGTGYYTFASWDDFVQGQKPVDYALTYSTVPGVQKPGYSFNYLNISAFAQDHVIVNDRFSFTAGLRVDLPVFPTPLIENPLVASLSFARGQHLNTSQLPKAAFLFSPRAGFILYLDNYKNWRLRGGTGIFTGRIPFVWIISQARYSGMLQITQTWQGKQNTPGPFDPDPQKYVPAVLPVPGTTLPSITSVLSKDLKMPQTWKFNMGMDARLPGGLVASVDGLYNKDIYAIGFKDVNLVDPQPLNIPGYPDHRLVYPAAVNQRFINPLNAAGQPDKAGRSPFNAVMVDNRYKGYYWSVAAQVEKRFRKGFAFTAAYIQSMAKSYNDGDGDQTLSALNATPNINGINQADLSYAGYVSPQRVVATFTYQKLYFKNFKVAITLVYQGAHDGRFSYTYSQDLTHDGTNRSLIYVPKQPSEITFVPITSSSTGNVLYTAQQQSDAFFKYVDQDKYLRTRAGNYAERNGGIFPWRNQADLKFTHDFTLARKNVKHTLQLSVDVFNIGNLLKPDWGVRNVVNASSILIPANLDAIQPNGTVIPTFQMATVGGKLVSETFRNDISLNSTWSVQCGIRYLFN